MPKNNVLMKDKALIEDTGEIMSLQFYFGGSGAGKSRKLHEDMLEWADREPEKNFFFLVPDQFTMQTQFDLVTASACKGIMNIDVLSFGRLAHRIFEETGFGLEPVLDDTGKSLVLRRTAAGIKEQLPVIGGNLNKIGYIHEIKSALSEFMQYGIGTRQLEELTEYAKNRGTLYYKLKDLGIVYQAFLNEINKKFITTEETLELLTRAVEKSDIIKDSVVILDGFTGFTPIQNRLVQRLMELTNRVIVSITIDISENPFEIKGEQELFYLSKKTVRDLCRLAEEAGVKRTDDIFLKHQIPPRFQQNSQMAHLEKQLFRYPLKPYQGKETAIQLMEALSPAGEAKQVCMKIKELVLEEKYSYRDIAVVAGDLETYGDYLERESGIYEIPVFMDRTRGLLLNPFIEYIRSTLKILLQNFSYEAVFHYLRSGLADFDREEVDRLENYVLALGLKGRRKWSRAFTRPPGGKEEEQTDRLEALNRTRERLMTQLEPLMERKKTAGEYVKTLYEFIVSARIQEKLAGYEKRFQSENNPEKAKEYAQIYRLVMEVLEQIEGLLRTEEMTLQEFADILDAGFGEIQVGMIPGSVDRVVVGDMERTRLKQVKVLFFLGVNDGNIPKNSQKGGIISDIDREFLQESGFELAPTPRQQMYIQRLYLYMNLTKPSEKLYLSYARVNSEGKTIRPSYLIDMIEKLFPEIQIQKPELIQRPLDRVIGRKDGLSVLAQELCSYAEGRQDKKAEEETASLLKLYRRQEAYAPWADRLLEAAFMQYSDHPLSQAVARAVYGSVLENSVSRLEKYAACAYAHFLQYGLQLKEREAYSFEQTDLGNIYHGVLEVFAGKLEESGYTWFDFSEEEGDKLLKEALEQYAVSYGETILYSNARYEYMIDRIYRILKRTVSTLKEQLRGGAFTPAHFEMSFSKAENLEAVNIALTEEEKMKLKGRIDRIDTYEDDNHVYVKVIDYKSGNKKFDLAALYYGLQLQLVVYMKVAVENERNRQPNKEIVPAALLYYHVNDPLIKEEGELKTEEINAKLLKELRMTGVVNGDDRVVSLLDSGFSDKSLIIPVERKKDGSFSANSSIISSENYEILSSFVSKKIKDFGKEILGGTISVNPCEQGSSNACTYCSFKGVCGFDEKISGYQKRMLKNLPEDELMEKMEKELEDTKERKA